MAKDGTMRGGARVGSGRKSKALTEKIGSGLAASVIELPEPEEISGEDVASGEGVFEGGSEKRHRPLRGGCVSSLPSSG